MSKLNLLYREMKEITGVNNCGYSRMFLDACKSIADKEDSVFVESYSKFYDRYKVLKDKLFTADQILILESYYTQHKTLDTIASKYFHNDLGKVRYLFNTGMSVIRKNFLYTGEKDMSSSVSYVWDESSEVGKVLNSLSTATIKALANSGIDSESKFMRVFEGLDSIEASIMLSKRLGLNSKMAEEVVNSFKHLGYFQEAWETENALRNVILEALTSPKKLLAVAMLVDTDYVENLEGGVLNKYSERFSSVSSDSEDGSRVLNSLGTNMINRLKSLGIRDDEDIRERLIGKSSEKQVRDFLLTLRNIGVKTADHTIMVLKENGLL